MTTTQLTDNLNKNLEIIFKKNQMENVAWHIHSTLTNKEVLLYFH